MTEPQDRGIRGIMIQLNNYAPREIIKKLRANGAVVLLHEGGEWTQVRFKAGTTFNEGAGHILVFGKDHIPNSSYPYAWVDLVTIWEDGKILWKNPNFKLDKRLAE